MPSLKSTTGHESVQQYRDTWGFCHWQAQEVIKVRDKLAAALQRYIDCDPVRDVPGDTPASQARAALG